MFPDAIISLKLSQIPNQIEICSCITGWAKNAMLYNSSILNNSQHAKSHQKIVFQAMLGIGNWNDHSTIRLEGISA